MTGENREVPPLTATVADRARAGLGRLRDRVSPPRGTDAERTPSTGREMTGDPTSDRFFDFDARFAQEEQARARQAPLRVQLLGEVWELPGTLPLAVTVQVSRWHAAGRATDDLTAGEMFSLVTKMVPGSTVDEWADRGLTTEQFGDVVRELLGHYAPRAVAS